MGADFPKPKYITGGCLCEKLRYRVDFPQDHDFEKNSTICHCTQCRKQTGSLYLPAHGVDSRSAFRWTSCGGADSSNPPESLRHYRATPQAERGFCADCGSLMYWRRVGSDTVSIAVGSVDPLFLVGQGAEEYNKKSGKGKSEGVNDSDGVPEGGFGIALVNGGGGHLWCTMIIPGITERMGDWFTGAKQWPEDDE
ncbi:hypothetical protein F5Y16DRAFT_186498 [Xylariaceae sp. FL0255]|nr:hypothetical protein F5Y16DRAFT_186498 [Xylariaceae sp. FL0255]